MKADKKEIEWLLANISQYQIAKETGVAQSALSRLVTGKRDISKLTLEVASKLTDFSKKMQNK